MVSMNNKETFDFPKINASNITTCKIDGSKYNPKMLSKSNIDILKEENEQLKSQLQSKKQELNGLVTTISKYLELEEPEHTTYDEIIKKIVNLKDSAIKLQQRDEVIEETIKFIKSLSSKGRDCMIYADVKKDILDTLNRYKNN